jgi:hypothetical protein
MRLRIVNIEGGEEWTRLSDHGVPRVGEIVDREGGKNYAIVSIRWRDYRDDAGLLIIEPVLYVREMGE